MLLVGSDPGLGVGGDRFENPLPPLVERVERRPAQRGQRCQEQLDEHNVSRLHTSRWEEGGKGPTVYERRALAGIAVW